MLFNLKSLSIFLLSVVILCVSTFFVIYTFHGDTLSDDYLNLNSAPPTYPTKTTTQRIGQNALYSSSAGNHGNDLIYIKNYEKQHPIPTQDKRVNIQVFAHSGHVQRFPKNAEAITNTLCNPLLKELFTGSSITVLETPHEPRAWINGSGLSLSIANIGPSEVSALLIHEGAHHLDLTRFQNNPARSKFTSISWQTSDLKKANAKMEDFVSGYALTNDYEDFAESLTMFVLFNEEFAQRAQTNEALKKKYLFLQDFVFGQGEFHGTNYASGSIEPYNWDMTRVEIDQKKYANLAKANIMTSSCFELISPDSVVTQ